MDATTPNSASAPASAPVPAPASQANGLKKKGKMTPAMLQALVAMRGPIMGPPVPNLTKAGPSAANETAAAAAATANQAAKDLGADKVITSAGDGGEAPSGPPSDWSSQFRLEDQPLYQEMVRERELQQESRRGLPPNWFDQFRVQDQPLYWEVRREWELERQKVACALPLAPPPPPVMHPQPTPTTTLRPRKPKTDKQGRKIKRGYKGPIAAFVAACGGGPDGMSPERDPLSFQPMILDEAFGTGHPMYRPDCLDDPGYVAGLKEYEGSIDSQSDSEEEEDGDDDDDDEFEACVRFPNPRRLGPSDSASDVLYSSQCVAQASPAALEESRREVLNMVYAYDESDEEDEEAGASGALTPSEFAALAKNIRRWEEGLVKPEGPKDQSRVRPSTPELEAWMAANEADNTGHIKYKFQRDEETGSMLSGEYSVPENPPILWNAPGIPPSMVQVAAYRMPMRRHPIIGAEIAKMEQQIGYQGPRPDFTTNQLLSALAKYNGPIGDGVHALDIYRGMMRMEAQRAAAEEFALKKKERDDEVVRQVAEAHARKLDERVTAHQKNVEHLANLRKELLSTFRKTAEKAKDLCDQLEKDAAEISDDVAATKTSETEKKA